ncbi:TPA: hypothetical protein HA219_03995, partial [Candidatus Woesearchaeota archaeon]|nr:hypothetical protein [Candidatus Woesearchaeota archaeon]
GNYKLKECVKGNIWPGGDEIIKESCSTITYDYDSPLIPEDAASVLCSTSQFSGGVYGIWNDAQNCCRGDDLSETCPLP